MATIKNTLLATAAMIAVSATAPLPSFAEDQSGTNQAETGEVVDTGQDAISTAYDLYAYGQDNNDALAVITAAKIIATTPVNESEATVEEKVEEWKKKHCALN